MFGLKKSVREREFQQTAYASRTKAVSITIARRLRRGGGGGGGVVKVVGKRGTWNVYGKKKSVHQLFPRKFHSDSILMRLEVEQVYATRSCFVVWCKNE